MMSTLSFSRFFKLAGSYKNLETTTTATNDDNNEDNPPTTTERTNEFGVSHLASPPKAGLYKACPI